MGRKDGYFSCLKIDGKSKWEKNEEGYSVEKGIHEYVYFCCMEKSNYLSSFTFRVVK